MQQNDTRKTANGLATWLVAYGRVYLNHDRRYHLVAGAGNSFRCSRLKRVNKRPYACLHLYELTWKNIYTMWSACRYVSFIRNFIWFCLPFIYLHCCWRFVSIQSSSIELIVMKQTCINHLYHLPYAVWKSVLIIVHDSNKNEIDTHIVQCVVK